MYSVPSDQIRSFVSCWVPAIIPDLRKRKRSEGMCRKTLAGSEGKVAGRLPAGAKKIHHTRLRNVSGAPTGHAVVMLQSDGQNSIIIVGGANMSCWPDAMCDEDLVVVRNAGIVLLQREIPDFVNIQVAKVRLLIFIFSYVHMKSLVGLVEKKGYWVDDFFVALCGLQLHTL
ncbi:uncharacterized protein LOC114322982 [Camellia sinensis]|uniref:uncharacterized protein LOC114322982 n=1 Tax=Camellia sinensis TaxID=4442 RepID=UPI001036ADF0|nr:uncharacterized protein LOC114322982 [Camellia sinensis]